MDSRIALLWLTLFGADPSIPPSALAEPIPIQSTAAVVWIGDWLVRGERHALRVIFRPVAERTRFAAMLTHGDGPSAVSEDWIGRQAGRVILLSRSGVGGAQLSLDHGHLVGRLSRHDATGTVRLSRTP